MSSFYYRVFGEEFGPVSLESLQRQIESGQLTGDHEVRHWNETNWIRVSDFAGHDMAKDRLTADLVCVGAPDDIEAKATDCNVSAAGTIVPPQENSGLSLSSPNSTAEVDFETSSLISTQQPPELATVEAEPLWWARMGRVERGPMEFQKLNSMAVSGHILPSDRVRQSDKSEWVLAQSIPGLFSNDSSTNRSDSPSAAATARPSRTSPVDSASMGSSPQAARAQTDTSASVRRAVLNSWPSSLPASSLPASSLPASSLPASTSSTAHQPNFTVGPIDSQDVGHAHSQEPVSRSMIGSSELPTEPSRHTVDTEPQRPQLQPREDESEPREDQPVDGWHSSEKSISQKHRLRRGQFQEPRIVDRKTFIGIVIAVALLMYGWSLIPATVGSFESPHNELLMLYYPLNKRVNDMNSVDSWIVIKKEFVHKISSVEQKVRNLNSRHGIRACLLSACYHMKLAAKNEGGQADRHMELARDQLRAASEILQKWKAPQEK